MFMITFVFVLVRTFPLVTLIGAWRHLQWQMQAPASRICNVEVLGATPLIPSYFVVFLAQSWYAVGRKTNLIMQALSVPWGECGTVVLQQ